jgi:hypothetical protein
LGAHQEQYRELARPLAHLAPLDLTRVPSPVCVPSVPRDTTQQLGPLHARLVRQARLRRVARHFAHHVRLDLILVLSPAAASVATLGSAQQSSFPAPVHLIAAEFTLLLV